MTVLGRLSQPHEHSVLPWPLGDSRPVGTLEQCECGTVFEWRIYPPVTRGTQMVGTYPQQLSRRAARRALKRLESH